MDHPPNAGDTLSAVATDTPSRAVDVHHQEKRRLLAGWLLSSPPGIAPPLIWPSGAGMLGLLPQHNSFATSGDAKKKAPMASCYIFALKRQFSYGSCSGARIHS